MSHHRRSRDPSSDRERSYDDAPPIHLPLNEGEYQYYPRFYPSWTWNPYSLSAEEQEAMTKRGAPPPMEGRFYAIGDDGRRIEQGTYQGAMYDNAGYMGYRGHTGGSYKLKPASYYSGEESYRDDRDRASRRRCCVVMSILGLLLLIAAGIAIGVYFGVVDKPESDRQAVTTPAPTAVTTVQISLVSNEPFTDDLYDPNSNAYQTLAAEAKQEIDTALKNSDHSLSYYDTEIIGFSLGSTIILANIQYSSNQVPSGTQMLPVTAQRVLTVLKPKLTASSTSFARQLNVEQTNATVVAVKGNSDLGDSCQSDADCQDANTVCTGSPSVCTCVSGYYNPNPNNNGGVCREGIAYGVACTDPQECLTADAVCDATDNVCTCSSGHYYNSANDRCLTKLAYEIGSGCTDPALQCVTQNAVCSGIGQCTCAATDYRDVSGQQTDKCTTKVGHGASCSETSQCSTSGATCQSGTCGCVTSQARYIAATNLCKPLVDNGQVCDVDEDCKLGGATCNSNICGCGANQYPTATQCVNKKENGLACSSDIECSYQNAVCQNSICACDVNDYADANTMSCLNKVGHNGVCQATIQCATVGAQCHNSRCTCLDYYYSDGADACQMKIDNGFPCGSQDQCKLTGAVCQTTCQCDADSYPTATACETKKAFGDTCTAAAECSTENSVCNNNVCGCADVTFYNPTSDTCTPKKANGEPCTASSECLILNAECPISLGARTCQCNAVEYSNGQACVQKIALGEACEAADACIFSRASCENSVCSCIGDTYPGNTDCMDKKALGEPCGATNECLYPFSECDTTCKCPLDRYDDGTKCELKSDNGEPCTMEEQCGFDEAGCYSNICSCPLTAFEIIADKRCQQKYDIGAVGCASAGQCLYTDALCNVAQTCVCEDDRFPSVENTACLPKLPNQSPCTEDIQCAVTGATCLEINTVSQCSCIQSEFELNGECVPLSAYRGPCGESSNCLTQGAECINQECICGDNFFHDTDQDRCSEKVGQNEACTDASQCSTGNAICSQNQCTCDVDYFYDDALLSCEPKVDNGEACTKNTSCRALQAKCLAGICSCTDDMYFRNNSCHMKKANGLVCTTVDECLNLNAQCEASTCSCPPNTYDENQECKPKSQNGGPCGDRSHCMVDNAGCINFMCNCTADMYLEGNMCKPKVANGQACTHSGKCAVVGAVCDIFCKCEDGDYEAADGTCRPKAAYNGPCTEARMCLTGNSICRSGMCDCDQTFFYDQILDTCTLKKFIKGPCSADEQCMPGFSECQTSSSTCQCMDGNYFGGADCLPLLVYGDACDNVDQCGLTDGICETTCTCAEDKYPNNNICVDKIDLGGICPHTDACKHNGATCSQTCQCLGNTYSTDTACLPLKEYGRLCTLNEECLTNLCFNQRCGCQNDQYFDSVAAICLQKVAFNEVCTQAIQCDVTDGACNFASPDDSTGTCGCAAGKNFAGNSCLEGVGDGGACSSDSQCTAFPGSVCTAQVCSCPLGTFANSTGTGSCDPKKAIGESCEEALQCAAGNSICNLDSQCVCRSTDYPELNTDGTTTCVIKKANGEACGDVSECAVRGAICATTCMCADGFYLPQGGSQCVSKKNFNEACSATVPCMQPFLCDNGLCACQAGYALQGQSECVMVPTTTMPTTTLPPEVDVTVDVVLEVPSDQNFTQDLNDPDSPGYQTLAVQIEQDMSAELNGSQVQVTGFSQGSVIVTIIVIQIVDEDVIVSVGDVDNFGAVVAAAAKQKVVGALQKIKANPNAVDFFTAANVEDVQVDNVVEEPCAAVPMIKAKANSRLCSNVLNYIRRSPDNRGLCRAYNDLLDCVAYSMKHDGSTCLDWNKMRGTLERLVLQHLNTNQEKNRLRACRDTQTGHQTYTYDPAHRSTGDRPCMDSTPLAVTIPYIREEELACSGVDAVTGLTVDFLIEQYHADYATCTQDQTAEMLAMIRDGLIRDPRDAFGIDLNIDLQTCPFCRSENLRHVYIQHCGETEDHLRRGEDFCPYFMMEAQCIAAYTRGWTEECGLDTILEIVRDPDTGFLDEYADRTNTDVPDDMCAGTPVVSYGPAATGIVDDQAYIKYLLDFTDCMPDDRASMNCLDLMRTARCLVGHLREESVAAATMDGVMRSLAHKPTGDNMLYLIDILEGLDTCWADYEALNQCEVYYLENLSDLRENCMPDYAQRIANALMDEEEAICGFIDSIVQCQLMSDDWFEINNCGLGQIEQVARSYLEHLLLGGPYPGGCPVFGQLTVEEAMCRSDAVMLSNALQQCDIELLQMGDNDCGSYENFRRCIGEAMFDNCNLDITQTVDVMRSMLFVLQRTFNIDYNCIVPLDGVGSCPNVPVNNDCNERENGRSTCSSHRRCGDGELCCRLACSYHCIPENVNELCPAPSLNATECSDQDEDQCSYEAGSCPTGEVCCHNGCFLQCVQEYVEEPCQFTDNVLDLVRPCVQENMYTPRPMYQVCSFAQNIASCLMRNQTTCDESALLLALSNNWEAFQNHVDISTDLDPALRIAWETLANYNYDTCQATDHYDINPCESCQPLQESYNECAAMEEIDMDVFNDPESEQLCSTMANLIECVVKAMLSRRARCHHLVEQVAMATMKHVMMDYPESGLTMERLNKCRDSVSICSYTFMFWENNPCLEDLYSTVLSDHEPQEGCGIFDDGPRNAFRYYMNCTMLMASYHEQTSCTVDKYLELLANAPQPVFFNRETDYETCLGNEVISELRDPCTSPGVINIFLPKCQEHLMSSYCPFNLAQLPIDTQCTTLFLRASCVKKALPQCNLTQIIDAFDEKSNTIVPGLRDAQNNCNIVPEDISECSSQMLGRYEEMRGCIHFLHNTSSADQDIKCSMLSESLRCLQEFRLENMPEVECSTQLLKDFIATVLMAEAHAYLATECRDDLIQPSIGSYTSYATCDVEAAQENLCENQAKLAMFIKYSCPQEGLIYRYDCSDYRKVIRCALNETRKIGAHCDQAQITTALESHEEIWQELLPHISPDNCTTLDMGRQDVMDALDHCMPESLIEHMVEQYYIKCNIYHYVYSCLSTQLQDVCGIKPGQIHYIMAARFESVGNWSSWIPFHPYCMGDVNLQLCHNTKDLYPLASSCFPLFHEIGTGTDEICPNLQVVEDCVMDKVMLYKTYDCNVGANARQAAQRLIVAKARKENWFNLLSCYQDEGYHCPAIQDAESCENREEVEDECSLPSDCVDQGETCCFDGCALRCVPAADTTVDFLLWLSLVDQYSYNPDYEQLDTPAARELIQTYTTQLDELMEGFSYVVDNILPDHPLVLQLLVTSTNRWSYPEGLIRQRMEKFECLFNMSGLHLLGLDDTPDQEMCSDSRPSNGYCHDQDSCRHSRSCQPYERCCRDGDDECGTCTIVEDVCNNVNFISNIAVSCIRDAYFDDSDMKKHRFCSSINRIVECVYEANYQMEPYTRCDRQGIVTMLEANKGYLMRRIRRANLPFNPTFLMQQLQMYSRDTCNDTSNQVDYACSDEELKQKAYQLCVGDAGSVNFDQEIDDQCRTFHTFQDCFSNYFGEYGESCRWETEDQGNRFLYNSFREANITTDIDVAIMDFKVACAGKMPVCSISGLRDVKDMCQNKYIRLKNNYDFKLGHCSNSSDAMALKEFISCARLVALSRQQEDCTANMILEVLRADPLHGQLFASQEDLDFCMAGEIVATVDGYLPSRASVCTSPMAIEFVHMYCNTSDTCNNYKNIAGEEPVCWVYIVSGSCVVELMKNLTFECTLSHIAQADYSDWEGDSVFDLSPTTKQSCADMLTSSDFECKKSLATKGNASIHCFEHMYGEVTTLSESVQCNLYHMSDSCLSNVVTSGSLSCSIVQASSFLPTLAQAAHLIYRNKDCCNNNRYTPPIIGIADRCSLTDPPASLCDTTDNDVRAALMYVIKSGCAMKAMKQQQQLREIIGFLYDVEIPEDTFTCLGLSFQLDCAVNKTSSLGLNCNSNDVTGLFSQMDLSGQPTSQCQTGCFDESEEYKKCFQYGVIMKLVDWYDGSPDDVAHRCRVEKYLRRCGETRMPDTCSDFDRNLRVNVTIGQALIAWNGNPYYPQMSCPDEDVGLLCDHTDDLSKLAMQQCGSEIYYLTEDCTYLDRVTACVGGLLDAYGDCATNDERDRVIFEAIMAAVRQYDAYKNDFVLSCLPDYTPREGMCPIFQAMASPYCNQPRDSTCLLDNDCNGDQTSKCCLGSCKSFTCQQPATDPVTILAWLKLNNDRYRQGVEDLNSPAAVDLINKYIEIMRGAARTIGANEDSVQITAFRRGYVYEEEDIHMQVTMETMHLVQGWTFNMVLNDNYPQSFDAMEWDVLPPNNMTDREGECPIMAVGRSSLDYCEYDVQCPDQEKCCDINYNRGCWPPVPELADCQDTSYIEPYISSCEPSIQNVQDYTCGPLFQTAHCVLDAVNSDRPPFYECNSTDLAIVLQGLLDENSVTLTYDNLFSCQEYELELTVYADNNQSCADSMAWADTWQGEIMAEVFSEPSDIKYYPDKYGCEYGTHRYMYDVMTADQQLEIYNRFWNYSKVMATITETGGPDRCNDERTIELFVRQSDCLSQMNEYMGYNACRKVEMFKECLESSISSATNYDSYCHGQMKVFANPDARTRIAQMIRDLGYQQFGDQVEEYDRRICSLDGSQCNYFENYRGACQAEIQNIQNMYSDIEICTVGFSDLVSCLATYLDDREVYCTPRFIRSFLQDYWWQLELPYEFDPFTCNKNFMFEFQFTFANLAFDEIYRDMLNPTTVAFIQNEILPVLNGVFDNLSVPYTFNNLGVPYTLTSLSPGSVRAGVHASGGPDLPARAQERVDSIENLVFEWHTIEESDMVCFAPNFNKSFGDLCQSSWMAYQRTDDCRHLDMFLACMKYNAWMRGQLCLLPDLYPQLVTYVNNNRSGDSIWNSTWSQPDSGSMSNVSMELCPCKLSIDLETDNHWVTLETNSSRPNGTIRVMVADVPENIQYLAVSISDLTSMRDVYAFEVQPAPGMRPRVIKGDLLQGETLFQPDMNQMMIPLRMYRESYYHVFTFELPKVAGDGRDVSLTGEINLHLYTLSVDSTRTMTVVDTFTTGSAVDLTCPPEVTDMEYLADWNNEIEQGLTDNVCRFWAPQRYFLEYECDRYIDDLSNDELCLMDSFAQGCVLQQLHGTGQTQCTRDDIVALWAEIDDGLLDIVNRSNCVPLSQCQEQVLERSSELLDTCFSSVGPLSLLDRYNMTMIGNADNSTSLACSVFRDTMQCVFKHVNMTECEAERELVKHLVLDMSSIAQKVWNGELRRYVQQNITDPSFAAIFEQPLEIVDLENMCPDELQYEPPAGDCPNPRFVADTLVAQCSIRLILMELQYGSYYPGAFDPCRFGPMVLQECAREVFGNDKPSMEFCDIHPDQLSEQAIQQYSPFFSMALGYDPIYCASFSECQQEIQNNSACLMQYDVLPQILMGVTDQEACLSIRFVHASVRRCFMEEASLSMQCRDEQILNGTLNTFEEYIVASLQNRTFENCEDYSEDCHSYGVMTYLRCIIENDFDYDACRLLDCVTNTPPPPGCTFRNSSGMMITPVDEVLNVAQRLVGYRPMCYEDQPFVVRGTILSSDWEWDDAFYNRRSEESTALAAWLNEQFMRELGISFTPTNFWPGSTWFGGMLHTSYQVRQRIMAHRFQNISIDSMEVNRKYDPYAISPCDEQYYDTSKYSCSFEWDIYKEDYENCSKYEALLGCVTAQARANNFLCEVRIMHGYLSMGIMGEGYPMPNLCPCEDANCTDRLTYLQNMVLPKNRDDLCFNVALFNHLLQVRCFPPEYDEMQDTEICRTQSNFAASCVYPILEDLGDCSLQQTYDLFTQSTECTDDDLPSQCERDIEWVVDSGQGCLDVLRTMERGDWNNVDLATFQSSSGNGETLRCSLLTEQINCILITEYKPDIFRDDCDKNTLVETVIRALNKDELTRGKYDTCQVDLTRLTGTIDGCPASYYVADGITGYCGPRVENAFDPCIAFNVCAMEAKAGYVALYERVCPWIHNAFRNYTMDDDLTIYFESATTINVTICFEDHCSAMLLPYIQGGCLDALTNLEELASSIDLDTYRSSSGTETLRCSMLIEQTRCLVHTGGIASIFTPECSVEIFIQLVEAVVKNSQQYVGDNSAFCPPDTFDAGYLLTPFSGCPTEDYYTDVTSAYCGQWMRVTADEDQCEASKHCKYLVNTGLSLQFPQCGIYTYEHGNQIADTSSFKDYFMNVTTLDLNTCTEGECRQAAEDDEARRACLGFLQTTVDIWDSLSPDEKCGVSNVAMAQARQCLFDHVLPEKCHGVPDFVPDILDSMLQQNGKPTRNNCESYDRCESYGASTMVECSFQHRDLDDCNLLDCFLMVPSPPEECTFTSGFNMTIDAGRRIMGRALYCYDDRTFLVQGILDGDEWVWDDVYYDLEANETQAAIAEIMPFLQAIFGDNLRITRLFEGSFGFDLVLLTTYASWATIQRNASDHGVTITSRSVLWDTDLGMMISPCDARYFDIAVTQDCNVEWDDLMEDPTSCENVESFVGCIATNARSKQHGCGVDVMWRYVERLAEERYQLVLELCPCENQDPVCNRVDELQNNILPQSRADICTNERVFTHLLEKRCMPRGYNESEDPTPCKSKAYYTSTCVREYLESLADCNLMQALELLIQTTDCVDANITLSECERNIQERVQRSACMDALYSIERLGALRDLDMSSYPWSTGEGTMRCRFFTEELRCLLMTERDIVTDECTVATVATAMERVMNRYVVGHRMGTDYYHCPVDTNLAWENEGCPPDGYLTVGATAYCGTAMLETDGDQCWAFRECMSRLTMGVTSLFPNCTIIQDQITMMLNDTEFIDYFNSTIGLHVQECVGNEDACDSIWMEYLSNPCLEVLRQLEQLSYFQHFDMNRFPSSDGMSLLKCSLLSNQTACLINTTDISRHFTPECSPFSLAGFISRNVWDSPDYQDAAECEFDPWQLSAGIHGCPNKFYYADAAGAWCGAQVRGTDGAEEKCRSARDCIDQVGMGIGGLYMDTCQNVWQDLERYRRSPEFINYFERMSELNLYDCESGSDGDCGEGMFRELSEERCETIWGHFMSTNMSDCEIYHHFLMCVKTQDLASYMPGCSLAQYHNALLPQIPWTGEVCSNASLEELNMQFAESRDELCNSGWVAGIVIGYNCPPDMYADTEAKMCMSNFVSVLCLNNTLTEMQLGCSDEMVWRVVTHPEFVSSLIESGSFYPPGPNCSYSQEYACTKGVMGNHRAVRNCTATAHQFLRLSNFNVVDLNSIADPAGPDDTSLLKCGVWGDVMQCVVDSESHFYDAPMPDYCDMASKALAMRTLLRVGASERPTALGPEIFDNCTGLDILQPSTGCPSIAELGRVTVAHCGVDFVETMYNTSIDSCRNLSSCFNMTAGHYRERCGDIGRLQRELLTMENGQLHPAIQFLYNITGGQLGQLCSNMIVKAGRCPEPTGSGTCSEQECNYDLICGGDNDLKCCPSGPDGCGLTCQAPVFTDQPPI